MHSLATNMLDLWSVHLISLKAYPMGLPIKSLSLGDQTCKSSNYRNGGEQR
jgi:hypothetical protein